MTDTQDTPAARAFEAYNAAIEQGLDVTQRRPFYVAWRQAVEDEQAEAKRQGRLAQNKAARVTLVGLKVCRSWNWASASCICDVDGLERCACYRAAKAIIDGVRGE